MELIQQAGGRVHGCVDLHGWGERPACGKMPFCPSSPLPHPTAPSPGQAAPTPSGGHCCRQVPPCPTPLTCTKGLGARPLLGGLADPQGCALALIAPLAQVLAGGPVVVAIGGAGDVAVLRRLQDGAAPHCKERGGVRAGAWPYLWGVDPRTAAGSQQPQGSPHHLGHGR